MAAASRALSALTLGWALAGLACSDGTPSPSAGPPALVALTGILHEARVQCGAAPDSARQQRRWSFAEPRPEWTPISADAEGWLAPVTLEPIADGQRLHLGGDPAGLRVGGLRIDLGELRFSDWETVVVQARCGSRFAGVTLATNLGEAAEDLPDGGSFFASPDTAAIFNDGSVQSYAVPLRPPAGAAPDALLHRLGVLFGAPAPGSLDILAITLVPRGADFLEPVGSRSICRDGTTLEALFAHTPASLRWQLELPTGARLDVALGSCPGQAVQYRLASVSGGQKREHLALLVDDATRWQQRSIDLSALPAGPVELVLEASSSSPGAVALWGTPILSGAAAPDPAAPNVVFYVIDGGDANLMSAFGYGRPTTPFLEELAQEGVLFTRAYSNATWTQPSTVSFMTSLQHSVLGGLRRGIHSTAVPEGAVTMAQHFQRGGWQTASLTANPNAGRMIGLQRGVHWMRDVETESHATSSVDLAASYFAWREAYPGQPAWAHIQTTDVHQPNEPVPPFAGRFTEPGTKERLEQWEARLWSAGGAAFGSTSISGFYDQAIERAGLDRQAYFGARRDLYDETMAHQDEALRQLVAELKQRGEWERTLLVIGADHGHPAGTFARFGRGLIEPQPEPWQGGLLDAYATRVPLLVVWPGHIAGGRRVDVPVSMLDVLPTLLELCGLPAPEVHQGQSLVPLLRGEEQARHPVVLDEFRVDEATGELVGNIELIDGRWGASLEIGPAPEGSDPSLGRHAAPAGGRWGAVHPWFPDVPRLLLYDLEQDPFAAHAVNAEHPDLVARYTRALLEQWSAHRGLAQLFRPADEAPMTPEQLEQLRALGYIR